MRWSKTLEYYRSCNGRLQDVKLFNFSSEWGMSTPPAPCLFWSDHCLQVPHYHFLLLCCLMEKIEEGCQKTVGKRTSLPWQLESSNQHTAPVSGNQQDARPPFGREILPWVILTPISERQWRMKTYNHGATSIALEWDYDGTRNSIPFASRI